MEVAAEVASVVIAEEITKYVEETIPEIISPPPQATPLYAPTQPVAAGSSFSSILSRPALVASITLAPDGVSFSNTNTENWIKKNGSSKVKDLYISNSAFPLAPAYFTAQDNSSIMPVGQGMISYDCLAGKTLRDWRFLNSPTFSLRVSIKTPSSICNRFLVAFLPYVTPKETEAYTLTQLMSNYTAHTVVDLRTSNLATLDVTMPPQSPTFDLMDKYGELGSIVIRQIGVYTPPSSLTKTSYEAPMYCHISNANTHGVNPWGNAGFGLGYENGGSLTQYDGSNLKDTCYAYSFIQSKSGKGFNYNSYRPVQELSFTGNASTNASPISDLNSLSSLTSNKEYLCNYSVSIHDNTNVPLKVLPISPTAHFTPDVTGSTSKKKDYTIHPTNAGYITSCFNYHTYDSVTYSFTPTNTAFHDARPVFYLFPGSALKDYPQIKGTAFQAYGDSAVDPSSNATIRTTTQAFSNLIKKAITLNADREDDTWSITIPYTSALPVLSTLDFNLDADAVHVNNHVHNSGIFHGDKLSDKEVSRLLGQPTVNGFLVIAMEEELVTSAGAERIEFEIHTQWNGLRFFDPKTPKLLSTADEVNAPVLKPYGAEVLAVPDDNTSTSLGEDSLDTTNTGTIDPVADMFGEEITTISELTTKLGDTGIRTTTSGSLETVIDPACMHAVSPNRTSYLSYFAQLFKMYRGRTGYLIRTPPPSTRTSSSSVAGYQPSLNTGASLIHLLPLFLEGLLSNNYISDIYHSFKANNYYLNTALDFLYDHTFNLFPKGTALWYNDAKDGIIKATPKSLFSPVLPTWLQDVYIGKELDIDLSQWGDAGTHPQSYRKFIGGLEFPRAGGFTDVVPIPVESDPTLVLSAGFPEAAEYHWTHHEDGNYSRNYYSASGDDRDNYPTPHSPYFVSAIDHETNRVTLTSISYSCVEGVVPNKYYNTETDTMVNYLDSKYDYTTKLSLHNKGIVMDAGSKTGAVFRTTDDLTPMIKANDHVVITSIDFTTGKLTLTKIPFEDNSTVPSNLNFLTRDAFEELFNKHTPASEQSVQFYISDFFAIPGFNQVTACNKLKLVGLFGHENPTQLMPYSKTRIIPHEQFPPEWGFSQAGAQYVAYFTYYDEQDWFWAIDTQVVTFDELSRLMAGSATPQTIISEYPSQADPHEHYYLGKFYEDYNKYLKTLRDHTARRHPSTIAVRDFATQNYQEDYSSSQKISQLNAGLRTIDFSHFNYSTSIIGEVLDYTSVPKSATFIGAYGNYNDLKLIDHVVTARSCHIYGVPTYHYAVRPVYSLVSPQGFSDADKIYLGPSAYLYNFSTMKEIMSRSYTNGITAATPLPTNSGSEITTAMQRVPGTGTGDDNVPTYIYDTNYEFVWDGIPGNEKWVTTSYSGIQDSRSTPKGEHILPESFLKDNVTVYNFGQVTHTPMDVAVDKDLNYSVKALPSAEISRPIVITKVPDDPYYGPGLKPQPLTSTERMNLADSISLGTSSSICDITYPQMNPVTSVSLPYNSNTPYRKILSEGQNPIAPSTRKLLYVSATSDAIVPSASTIDKPLVIVPEWNLRSYMKSSASGSLGTAQDTNITIHEQTLDDFQFSVCRGAPRCALPMFGLGDLTGGQTQGFYQLGPK